LKAEAGRYHLYVALACPWAHRTLIMREIKGLQNAIAVSIVDPIMSDKGWMFSDVPGSIPDSVNHAQYLQEIYLKANPKYRGRITVPVLWDRQTQTIVNNESREIMRMLDVEFAELATPKIDLYPREYSLWFQQLKDCYLSAWVEYQTKQNLEVAFELAQKISPIPDIFRWLPVISNMDRVTRNKYIDSVPRRLREFLHNLE
jgi:Glutathione S-transferase, N-terminal domain